MYSGNNRVAAIDYYRWKKYCRDFLEVAFAAQVMHFARDRIANDI